MRTQLALMCFAILFATPIHAEVPLLGPAELEREAKYIVSGKVARVYTAEKVLEKGYVDTLYAIEVVVSRIEKGGDIDKSQSIYVKAWRTKSRPEGWVGPSGQATIPNSGQAVKLYLTGTGGSYNALSPNGIHVVK